MSDHTPDAGGGPSLTRAIRTMPRWKALLLVVSLVVGVVATGAYVTAHTLRKPQTITVQVPARANGGTTSGGVPVGGSGFVGGGGAPAAADQSQTVTTTTTPPPTLTEQYTPLVARIGFSFFVGLIAGTVTRVFLKLAAVIVALIVGAVAAAHYFNIDLDLTHVQAQTGQATTWMQGQLYQLWGVVREHLPSAGTGTAGFLFGHEAAVSDPATKRVRKPIGTRTRCVGGRCRTDQCRAAAIGPAPLAVAEVAAVADPAAGEVLLVVLLGRVERGSAGEHFGDDRPRVVARLACRFSSSASACCRCSSEW